MSHVCLSWNTYVCPKQKSSVLDIWPTEQTQKLNWIYADVCMECDIVMMLSCENELNDEKFQKQLSFINSTFCFIKGTAHPKIKILASFQTCRSFLSPKVSEIKCCFGPHWLTPYGKNSSWNIIKNIFFSHMFVEWPKIFLFFGWTIPLDSSVQIGQYCFWGYELVWLTFRCFRVEDFLWFRRSSQV